MTSYNVIIQSLGVSAGGKAAEKFLSHTISSGADPGRNVEDASPLPAIFNDVLDK